MIWKSLPYGDWEIEEPSSSSIDRAVGFVNPATEVGESDSRPERLAIGGVADVK